MTEDRWVKRTRDALVEAFFALAIEKGYEHVSVKNIVDRANVGRTTFYAHYSDKDDLLNSVLGTLFSSIGAMLSLEDTADISPARALFEHVDSHEHLQKAFDFDLISAKFQREVVLIVQRQLAKHAKASVDKRKLELKAEIVSGGLIASLKWWLKAGKPYSAEEMAAMLQRSFVGDIRL